MPQDVHLSCRGVNCGTSRLRCVAGSQDMPDDRGGITEATGSQLGAYLVLSRRWYVAGAQNESPRNCERGRILLDLKEAG